MLFDDLEKDINEDSYDYEDSYNYQEDEEDGLIEENLGVSVLDDDNYDYKNEDGMDDYLQSVESIINEKTSLYHRPVNLTSEQNKIYLEGIKKVENINKKYNCSLDFVKIIKELEQDYANIKKGKYSKVNKTYGMSISMWDKACSLAIDMEDKKAHSLFDKKDIEKDLKENLKEISSVVRLYVKIHPEQFPENERERTAIFNKNGKLRKQFVKTTLSTNHFEQAAIDLEGRTNKISTYYFSKFSSSEEMNQFFTNKIANIIKTNKNEQITEHERIIRLAECVRLLRPLQAKRDNRSVFDFFTKHKIYVAERDTLKSCKEEMKKLGLPKEEISKVLHGGSFGDVKFNDGRNVREILEFSQNNIKPLDVNNDNRQQISVDVEEKNDIVNEMIFDKDNSKDLVK